MFFYELDLTQYNEIEMIKSYYSMLTDWLFSEFNSNKYEF